MTESSSSRSTIGDVAAAAGVSRATVSRVMNNQATVNVDIARRVRQVAAELHYRPSNVARSLSIGRTHTIAVVVPDISNPMFQDIVRGLTEAAALEGYRVMVSDTDEDASDEPVVAREARARCDAVVLLSPSAPTSSLADLLLGLEPALVVGRGSDDQVAVPGLSIDFASGIVSLVEHLTSLGHREFIYLNGPASSPGNLARLTGFDRVEESHPNLRITQLSCGSRMEQGYAAAERVLAGQATAVIAYNDLVAFGLLSRLNEIGVAVPQDISVVGLDDIALASFAVPPLTTLAVPGAELGRRAWQQLRARIAGDALTPDEPFAPTLVERESTGPAAPRKSHRRQIAPRAITALAWHGEPGADVLMGDGLPLLRYERGEQLATVHSPRPYAHPIYSLTGVPLTTAGPRDHRHQYGLSLAMPDVNGTTYWGGRTYLPDLGPTLLANHGRQRVADRRPGSGEPTLQERLVWEDEYGDTWMTEDRSLTGTLLPDIDGWQLTWWSRLQAGDSEITFASPATNGRAGAGYGGVFWRFDGSPVRDLFSEQGSGEASVHGETVGWVAVVRGGIGGTTTVILRQPTAELLPWFCRASDYTGIGPAVAWDRPRLLGYGSSILLGLDAVILDRAVEPGEVESILDRCPPPEPAVPADPSD